MQNINQCISCQNNLFTRLPIPHPNQSMLSDGKLIKKPLEKEICSHCGLIKHCQSIDDDEIQSFYQNDYSLTKQDDQYEKKRAISYANAIQRFLDRKDFGSILEIGCGSGFLLRELYARHLGNDYEGFDPAFIENSGDQKDIFVTYKASDLTNTKKENYQTIISINTLEHIADPFSYLRQIEQKMSIDSDLILVLPSHFPANVELLFFDHLWTYTPIALSNILKKLNLSLIQYEFLKNELLGFTIYRIKKNTIFKEIESHHIDISNVCDYLKAWQQLDLKLYTFFKNQSQNSSTEINIFGAGQMTALLKIYAPNVFNLCHAVVADVPSKIWLFDHFQTYDNVMQNKLYKLFLISVHPTIEDYLSKKIENDGATSVKLSSFLSV